LILDKVAEVLESILRRLDSIESQLAKGSVNSLGLSELNSLKNELKHRTRLEFLEANIKFHEKAMGMDVQRASNDPEFAKKYGDKNLARAEAFVNSCEHIKNVKATDDLMRLVSDNLRDNYSVVMDMVSETLIGRIHKDIMDSEKRVHVLSKNVGEIISKLSDVGSDVEQLIDAKTRKQVQKLHGLINVVENTQRKSAEIFKGMVEATRKTHEATLAAEGVETRVVLSAEKKLSQSTSQHIKNISKLEERVTDTVKNIRGSLGELWFDGEGKIKKLSDQTKKLLDSLSLSARDRIDEQVKSVKESIMSKNLELDELHKEVKALAMKAEEIIIRADKAVGSAENIVRASAPTTRTKFSVRN